MSDLHPQSKKNGLALVITATAALLAGLAAMFLPMQGQISSLKDKIEGVAISLNDEIDDVEVRSAGRRVDMDRLLQNEIRETKGLSVSQLENLDVKLQLEITALRELIEQQLGYAEWRYGRNEAEIRLLLQYHRDATNAERGSPQP